MAYSTSITPGRYSAKAVTSNLSVYTATVALTRPSNNTAYTAGDVIGAANTTTAANAGNAILTFPNVGGGGGAIRIDSVDLFINKTTVPSGMNAFRLHLYSIPPTAILDHAAFDLTSTDVPRYLGFVTLALPVDIGSTLYSSTVSVNKVVRMLPYSETLFGVLETRGGFAPSSGTLYTVKLNTTDVDEATTGSENLLWAYAGGAVPTLDLEFARTKTLNNQVTSTPPVIFTRASTGTFVGSNGLIQTTASDAPRFDHNPTTGESLGLLVEEARTNNLTYSEDISQWLTPTNITLSQNQTTAPDNLVTADQYLETAATGLHAQSSPAFVFVTGTTYTYSVFVQSIGGRNYTIGFPPTVFTARFANFDLSGSGSVQSVDVGVTADIKPYPNNWYRCSATSTCALGSGSRVDGFITNSSYSISYAGDVTKGLFIWGAQLEAGAFPTSYIPTTTATATRATDLASITGTNFSSWYNQTEGTVFADVNTAPVANIVQALFDLSEGAVSERMFQRRNTGSQIVTAVTDNGVVQGDFGSVQVSASGRARSGFAYRLNDFEAAVNGSPSGTGTSVTVPTPDRMHIGQNFGSVQVLNGTIKRLCFWPIRLSNPTLQAITTP